MTNNTREIISTSAVPYLRPGDVALKILDQASFQRALKEIFRHIAASAEDKHGTVAAKEAELVQQAESSYSKLLSPAEGEEELRALTAHCKELNIPVEAIFGFNLYLLKQGLEKARDIASIREATRTQVQEAIIPKPENLIFLKADGSKLTQDETSLVLQALEEERTLKESGRTGAGHYAQLLPDDLKLPTLHSIKLNPIGVDTITLSKKLRGEIVQNRTMSNGVQEGGSERKDLTKKPLETAINIINSLVNESEHTIHTLLAALENNEIPHAVELEMVLGGRRTDYSVAGSYICALLDKEGEKIRENSPQLYYKALEKISGEIKYAGWVLNRLEEEQEDLPLENKDVLKTMTKLNEFRGSQKILAGILENEIPKLETGANQAKYIKLYTEILLKAPDLNRDVQELILQAFEKQNFVVEDPIPPKPVHWFWRMLGQKTPQHELTELTSEQMTYLEEMSEALKNCLDLADKEGHERIMKAIQSRQRVLERTQFIDEIQEKFNSLNEE